jgi:gliding motility-associated-like protein
VEEAPTLNISVEGETKCVSGTTPIRLKANSTNSITWKWTNSAGVTISTAETLLLNNATSAQSNIYTVVAKNSANCESKGDIQLLVTDALPQVTAGLESSPCAGSTLRFNVNPIPGASYVWKDPSGKSFSSMQSPVLTNISDAINGNYTVTASRDGCSSTSAPLIVTVITAPKAEADEIAVAYEQAKFFNVVTNDKLIGPFNLNVLMLPSSGKLEDQGSGAFTYTPNPKYRETDKMLYEVCYKECPLLCNIAQVNLNVRHSFDNCVITTVFSPNNDGINDEFIISCLEGGLFKDNTLVVYNQWGDKVYSASPYKNDWKGTYNGDDLPDGTYFYVFRKDATSPFEKGFVMIQR